MIFQILFSERLINPSNSKASNNGCDSLKGLFNKVQRTSSGLGGDWFSRRPCCSPAYDKCAAAVQGFRRSVARFCDLRCLCSSGRCTRLSEVSFRLLQEESRSRWKRALSPRWMCRLSEHRQTRERFAVAPRQLSQLCLKIRKYSIESISV